MMVDGYWSASFEYGIMSGKNPKFEIKGIKCQKMGLFAISQKMFIKTS